MGRKGKKVTEGAASVSKRDTRSKQSAEKSQQTPHSSPLRSRSKVISPGSPVRVMKGKRKSETPKRKLKTSPRKIKKEVKKSKGEDKNMESCQDSDSE